MTRYFIIRNAAGGFTVQVEVGETCVAKSPDFKTEIEAMDWITESGQDSGYIIVRAEH